MDAQTLIERARCANRLAVWWNKRGDAERAIDARLVRDSFMRDAWRAAARAARAVS